MIKYYEGRVSLFKSLPNTANEIIFLGNSITDGAEWNEIFIDRKVKNRGINGDDITGVMRRLDEVTESFPDKIFLLIGTNDLKCKPLETILNNYEVLVVEIKRASPNTELYIQSIFPVIDSEIRNNKDIEYLNKGLHKIATTHDLVYLNIYDFFTDLEGQLDSSYTYDGVHLTGTGYLRWASIIKRHIYDD